MAISTNDKNNGLTRLCQKRTVYRYDTDARIKQDHSDVSYDIATNDGSLEGNAINIPPKWQAFKQMVSDKIYIMLYTSDLLSASTGENGKKMS